MNASVPLSLALGLGLSACSTSEIVVATTQHDEPGTRCATNADCPENAFCAKAECTDDRGGCEARPAICDDDSAPTCGCDGVNYWNDCLRRQAGVSSASIGECIEGVAACSDPGAQECPVSGASCARLVFPSNGVCDSQAPGTCWLLPDACPDGGTSDRWRSCSDSTACADTCTAIRSGVPYRLSDCP